MHRLSALLLALLLSACSGANVPADPSQAPSGLYDTDFGPLALSAPSASGEIDGRYADAHTLSEIQGVYRDGVLTGQWATQFMDGQCDPNADGLTAYGPVTLTFAEDLSGFSGTWGWCDGDEPDGSWNGSFAADLPAGVRLASLVAPRGGVRPRSDARPPAGVYVTGKGEMMIMPPDATGGFVGSLEEIGEPIIALAGTMDGSTLSGLWIDSETSGPCPVQNGATNWGRFEMELGSSTLNGRRGLCANGPLDQTIGGIRK